jgi:hypothetical protein
MGRHVVLSLSHGLASVRDDGFRWLEPGASTDDSILCVSHSAIKHLTQRADIFDSKHITDHRRGFCMFNGTDRRS